MKLISSGLSLIAAFVSLSAYTSHKVAASVAVSEKESHIIINLTDKRILNFEKVFSLVSGDFVQFETENGDIIKGIITKTVTVPNESYKCIGESSSDKNIGFGFTFTNTGVIAGAVLFRDIEKSFELTFDQNLKGFVFKVSTRLKKVEA